MMADCTELEICLKDLAKLGDDRKTASYDNFVNKTFDKTKKLLKLLSMPNDSFLDNFSSLTEDQIPAADIEKIIKIKGIKKQDAMSLFKNCKK